MMNKNELTELTNIGATVANRLIAIGVRTHADLAKLGSVEAYKKLVKRFPKDSLPVCYYLYSLEGALQDRHWDDFSEAEKQAMRDAAKIRR